MGVILSDTHNQIEHLLVSNKHVTEQELNDLKTKAKNKGEPLFTLMVTEGHISDEELTKVIAQATKVPYVNLKNARVRPEILGLLPQEIAQRYMAVPLGEMNKRLVIAMLDAGNVQAIDFLANKIGRPLRIFLASQEGIENIIKQYQIDVGKDVSDALGERGNNKQIDNSSIQTIVEDSPISKALSQILEYAANNNASDIHIEPLEKELRIRARIDGVLKEVMRLKKDFEAPLVSRVKILSNLKIDEHRIPQDGQFSIIVSKRSIDLRIAISPVVWGEQIVIRLLDKTGISLKLEDMGYSGRALKTIREGVKHSNGMVLTSGPTGSGKTTSLYALIQEIKSDEINIITLEDPVEYKMEGINQIQVNPEVGLTFANGLRSVLRQDPNVVMVGEIRDAETATLAVQAALTGHLVLSTLHTNSAAGILPRLLDMDIEPFLIASTVRTIIGQRLVRRIDGEPEAYDADHVEIEAINTCVSNLLPKTTNEIKENNEDLGYGDLPLAGQNAYTLYKGKSTSGNPSGYKGRLGLFEAFNVTSEIQDLILARATSSEIQEVAQDQGMLTMRQDGYMKALTARTTLSEVNRVAATDSA